MVLFKYKISSFVFEEGHKYVEINLHFSFYFFGEFYCLYNSRKTKVRRERLVSHYDKIIRNITSIVMMRLTNTCSSYTKEMISITNNKHI